MNPGGVTQTVPHVYSVYLQQFLPMDFPPSIPILQQPVAKLITDRQFRQHNRSMHAQLEYFQRFSNFRSHYERWPLRANKGHRFVHIPGEPLLQKVRCDKG